MATKTGEGVEAGAAQASAEAVASTFTRPQTGKFSANFYKKILDQIYDLGVVLTLTVSTGSEERVFFFTRGALLYLAQGPHGGEVFAKKLVQKKVFPKEKVDALVQRANSDVPLLQDILSSDNLLEAEQIKALVEEVVEERIVEVSLWDESLYDLVPGNPPPRLYEPDVPAVRLSLGMKNLLGRARPKVEKAPQLLQALGGSLRNRVKAPARMTSTLSPGDLPENARTILKLIPRSGSRTVLEVMELAGGEGISPYDTVATLAQLAGARHIAVEKAPEPSKKEELATAEGIEQAFQKFVNKLLVRAHLVGIYERVHENEKAAEQYRGMAEEHLAQDRLQEGLGALRQVIRLLPMDVAARERIVQVLRQGNKLAEAAKEAVELGRILLQIGLPGRARAAFELALKLAPKSLGILWMLAGLLEKLGERDEAIRRYEEIAEVAAEQGDQAGVVAANQQILAIAPGYKKAIERVRKMSGYAQALAARFAVAGVVVLAFLLVMSYGFYELLAYREFTVARDSAWASVDEGKFDIARARVREFQDAWSHSRAAKVAGGQLIEKITTEERVAIELRCGHEVKTAERLERERHLPEAIDHWKAAKELATENRELKQRIERKLAEAELARQNAIDEVTTTLATYLSSSRESSWREGYDRVARELERSPWLRTRPEIRLEIPHLIDSVPQGARLVVDGQRLTDRTPARVRRRPAPGTLLVEKGSEREPVERALEALPPFGILVVLPRKALWRVPEAVVSAAPTVVADRDLVLVGGRDRSVTAVGARDGALRWRNTTALGIFGECHLPVAALPKAGIAVVRADCGTVVALDLDRGTKKWELDVASPAWDPADPSAARPVPGGVGVVVREGPKGLVMLDAKTGQRKWETTVPTDVIGAPVVVGETVAVATERALVFYRITDGSRYGTPARLSPKLAATGVAASPTGNLLLGLDSGAIARFDREGTPLPVIDKVSEPGGLSAPLDASTRRIVAGLQKGEVVGIEARSGRELFHVAIDPARPVRWVRAYDGATPDHDVVLAGDGNVIVALDAKGDELWRHPVTGTAGEGEGAVPATADAARVYHGGDAGLAAFPR